MRPNAQLRFLVLLPLAGAALAWSGRYAWDHWATTAALDYPPTVDLGEREYGEVAVGRFTVTNRGRGELVLDEFFTSCSCAGVEREADGRFWRVESVLVPPGEQVELVVRVGVGVPSGGRQRVQVVFSSNDPTQPAGKIEVIVPHVKGGAFAVPTAALFGDVRVGSPARQVIDLYDNRQAGRRVEQVRSLQPERFEARLLPLDPQGSAPTHDRGGRLIARLEVIGQTSRPGPLNGRVEVSLAGEARQPDLIPVVAEVVRDVECRPSTLVLPRRAGERFVFSGRVLLRHRDGRAIRVEVEDVPPGMSAQVRPSTDGGDQCWLEVERTRAQPAVSGEKRIRLRVRSDESDSLLDVPVLLTTAPSAEEP